MKFKKIQFLANPIKHIFSTKKRWKNKWATFSKRKKQVYIALISVLLTYLTVCFFVVVFQSVNTTYELKFLHNHGIGYGADPSQSFPWYNLYNPNGKGGGKVNPRGFSVFDPTSWIALVLWPFYTVVWLEVQLVNAIGTVLKYLAEFPLSTLFRGSNGTTLAKWYDAIALIMMALIGVLITFFVISQWSKMNDPTRTGSATAGLVSKVFFVILLVIGMPLLFYGINALMLQITTYIFDISGFDNNFGNKIFKTGFTEKGLTADMSHAQVSYDWFHGLYIHYHYYPFIPLVNGIVLAYVLILVSISLVLRIFNILTLYVISPFAVVTSINDSYGRLIRWKDLLLAKYLESIIIIITVGIYFAFFDQVYNLLQSDIGGAWFVYVIMVIILTIGGAMYLLHGQALLCAILGTNTQIEQAQEHLGTFRAGALMVGAGLAFGIKSIAGVAKLSGRGVKALNKNRSPHGLAKKFNNYKDVGSIKSQNGLARAIDKYSKKQKGGVFRPIQTSNKDRAKAFQGDKFYQNKVSAHDQINQAKGNIDKL